MTRRINRNADFEMALQIKHDEFICPPRGSQRDWLLNKTMSEFAGELRALDVLARRFVPGERAAHAELDRMHDALSDEQIMEDWQIPLMEAMAAFVTESHGDVLEIGFGRGVSADFIQAAGVASHTIVECNPTIVARFARWKAQYAGHNIRMIEGLWQSSTAEFDRYDGIFFHAYPLTEAEYIGEVLRSVTYAAHFFETAARHLRPGGVFTYLTHEIDSLSRDQQRLLLRHFQEITVRAVRLSVPADTKDAWWADSMTVVKAVL